MSIYDLLFGNKPMLSDDEAERIADELSDMQYDHIGESLKPMMAQHIREYTHRVAKMKFSEFKREVERQVNSDVFAGNTIFSGYYIAVLRSINSDLVDDALREAFEIKHGIR